jgi:hypothetical protein
MKKKKNYIFLLPAYKKPTTGIEPVNLILTKDVLYQLSYMGAFFKSGQ